MRTNINQGYNHFLMEVTEMVKQTDLPEELENAQVENQPTRQVPKLSDNKKFLGRLRATRRYVIYGTRQS